MSIYIVLQNLQFGVAILAGVAFAFHFLMPAPNELKKYSRKDRLKMMIPAYGLKYIKLEGKDSFRRFHISWHIFVVLISVRIFLSVLIYYLVYQDWFQPYMLPSP